MTGKTRDDLRKRLAAAGDEELFTPGEVAQLFHVNPKTVSRWLKIGRLAAIRTPGGHHRVRAADLRKRLS